MANTYTAELQLIKPTPGDPLSQNTWGTLLNTDFDLLDTAIAGQLSLSVAGASNVVLTSVQGAADQERNQTFVFTGALTGDIFVLFPSGRTKAFSVKNSTTGAHTLSIGVNNSGVPLGGTVTVTQGGSFYLISDGTNVSSGISGMAPSGPAGGDLGTTYPNPTVVATHLSAPLPVTQGGTGGTDAATAKTSLGIVAVASSGSASDLTTGTLNAARLATSGVAAAAYTNANITVDAAGRVTAAANGSAGTVTSITAGFGLSGGTISSSGTIALVSTAGAVGTLAFAWDQRAIQPTSVSFGDTIAGSNLRPCPAAGDGSRFPSALSGTWQCLGWDDISLCGSGVQDHSTLWQRIA